MSMHQSFRGFIFNCILLSFPSSILNKGLLSSNLRKLGLKDTVSQYLLKWDKSVLLFSKKEGGQHFKWVMKLKLIFNLPEIMVGKCIHLL